jgi:hypothetical protein
MHMDNIVSEHPVASMILNIYRQTQKSVNQKYSLLLTGMFRIERPSIFLQGYHSVVSWVLNMENIISNDFF